MAHWQALPSGSFFPSARLDCALFSLSGARLCRENGDTLLALPYDEGAPFPLVELFCLARIARIGARRFVLYRLDAKNSPIFWEN